MVLDTHALIWLFINPEQLSPDAQRSTYAILASGGNLHISAISLLEMVYLIEKKRIPEATLSKVLDKIHCDKTRLTCIPLDDRIAVAARQIPREEVPDMPDRIIAATALHLRMPLIAKDRKIHASCIETIW